MDDKTLLQQERFYACIGRLIISWGQLELSLEFSIALIHEGLGGNKLQSEKPRMLEAKLTYLRRAAHELAPLKAHRKSTLKLADDLEAASIMRHDIVHGAIISPPNNPIGADMLRLLRKKGEPKSKRYRITTLRISKAMREAQDLSIQVSNFFELLIPICEESH